MVYRKIFIYTAFGPAFENTALMKSSLIGNGCDDIGKTKLMPNECRYMFFESYNNERPQ